tara:strand:+ start:2201 stop:2515 length:315 start_codon:yes stop_codon:yes gene_type:complete
MDELKELKELKEKAAPKFSELTTAIKKLNKEQIITNNLLCQLCDLKEAQQQEDKIFRNLWRKSRVRDTQVSLWILVLANVALYLDVIKIDSNGAFIVGLINLFK